MLLVSIIVEYQESLGGRCFSEIELLKDPLWRLYCNHLDWGMFLLRYKMSLVFSTTRAGNYVCVYILFSYRTMQVGRYTETKRAAPISR